MPKPEFNFFCLVFCLTVGEIAFGYETYSNYIGPTELTSDIPLNATRIELDSNKLKQIQDYELSRFTQLTWLTLYNNEIQNISEQAFNNTQIKELYLTDNELVAVPNVCVLSKTLEQLDLAGNNIKIVDPQYINCLTNIKILDLNENQISIISPQAFTNTQIKELYLSENELVALPDVCVLSETLEILLLSYNYIETVNPKHINCLTNIITLDLKANQISIISPQAFTNTQLKYLHLSENVLPVLPDVCALSETLELLELDGNNIKTVDPQYINCLTNIRILDLSVNQISIISPQAFTNTQITELYLSENILVTVPDVCVLSESLEILFLSYNYIQTVNPRHINCLTNITTLELSENRIINISSQAFTNTQIKELYLIGNKLKTVPDACVLSQTLEILDLHNNNIQTVDPQLINCLTNIKILYLSSNPFSRLSDNTFTGLELLKELYLIFTGISSPPVLINLHLTHLYIANTRITTLPDPALSNSQIDGIMIRGTDLVCNCSVAWMLLNNQRGWPSKVIINNQPCICKSRSTYKEIVWKKLTIDDLCQGDIKMWEITYQEGPSVTIRFQPQASTVTSPVDHYILQYSNVTRVDWINGSTVNSTGDKVEFLNITQDCLDSGIWYMLRVIPFMATPGGDTITGNIKLWDIINGTGPYVTIRFQTWDSKMTETIPLDHYVVQYHKHGDTDWMNGTTLTSTEENSHILEVTQNFLEPGILYMLRVIPVISGGNILGNPILIGVGGALITVGGVLFLLGVILLIGAVIYIKRIKDNHSYDDTELQDFPVPREESEASTHVSNPGESYHGNAVYENQDAITSDN